MVRTLFAITIALMLAGCGDTERQGAQSPAIEALPEMIHVSTAGLETAVVEHIESAMERLGKADRDINANGALATTLHTYNLFDAAEIAYRRTRILEPEVFRWHYLHGVVLQRLGRNDEALSALRAADAKRMGYIPLLLRFGELTASAGELKTSRNLYTKLAAAQPELVAAHVGLGRILAQSGETRAAVESFERAIELQPGYSPAHYALSMALATLGEDEAAARHARIFELGDQQLPPVKDPLLEAVWSLSRTSRAVYAQAIENVRERPVQAALEFEKILQEEPGNFGARANLIGLYGDLQKPEEAERHFQLGVAGTPDQPELYNNIGVVRLRYEQYQAAAEAFEEAIRLDPTYASGWRNLGKAQEEMGQHDEALTSYKWSVELDDKDRQAQYFYGRLLIETGSHGAAIEPLTAALEPVDARTPHYLYLIAQARQALGEESKAQDVLIEARSLAGRFNQTALLARIDADLEARGRTQ